MPKKMQKLKSISEIKEEAKEVQAEVVETKPKKGVKKIEKKAEAVKEPKEETSEEITKRLFGELHQLAIPVYNWLLKNFDENSFIEIRKGKITVEHTAMKMDIIDEVAEDVKK